MTPDPAQFYCAHSREIDCRRPLLALTIAELARLRFDERKMQVPRLGLYLVHPGLLRDNVHPALQAKANGQELTAGFLMTLHINGEPRDVPSGLTVAQLVAHLGMKTDRVAVELNLEILPRNKWEVTALREGDKLEIVHFVGGGAGVELNKDLSRGLSAQEEAGTAQPVVAANAWNCPTCGAPARSKFCQDCGEKKPSKSDFSIRHFFTHALGEFFHFDSKIFRSFGLLYARPGFLTAEYVRGCRKPYLHPFQLFFIANLIYFLMQPLIGWTGLRTTLYIQTHQMEYSRMASRMVDEKIAARGVTAEQFARSFDHAVDVQARSLAVIMVPMFALLIALLQWRKRQFFGQHLVFSLHNTAFWLTALFIGSYGGTSLLYRVFIRYGVRIAQLTSDNFLFPLTLLILVAYLLIAFRVVYGDSTVVALAKAAVVAFALHYVLAAYRFILFFIAFYSV